MQVILYPCYTFFVSPALMALLARSAHVPPPLHQKFEDSQLELAKVRQHYEEALDEIDEWRSRAGLPKINEVDDVSRSSPRKSRYPGCRCSHTVFKK
jgi:hypothetical protein